jgi:hypothetical protein
MFRFILYAFLACVTAFGGVSWAMRGFPNPAKAFETANPARAFETAVTSPVGAGPQQMIATTFGGQNAKDYERKMWEAEHTARSDNDPKLDRIRMEALQTADAYAMAPCGEFTRLNLIAALTAYTQAWQARIKDCPRLMGLPICGDKKLKEIAATFSTPLDLRVQASLAEAFRKGGIVIDDFPAEMRRDMLQFGGSGLWYSNVATCGVRHRSATTRRPGERRDP